MSRQQGRENEQLALNIGDESRQGGGKQARRDARKMEAWRDDQLTMKGRSQLATNPSSSSSAGPVAISAGQTSADETSVLQSNAGGGDERSRTRMHREK